MQNTKIGDYAGRPVLMVGIGGSSMSGLAEILKTRGIIVRGCDRTASKSTDKLKAMGIPVVIGHDASTVADAELLIYTAAIPTDNPERREARLRGIPEMERSELLGQLSSDFGKTIAISGAHGKTTVTAMLASVFIGAGKDPNVHIGGELPAMGGSVRTGDGEDFITEACEFAGSFLTLRPHIAVVLNIDADHLDYYKTIENIETAFATFVGRVREGGAMVGCLTDPRVKKLMDKCACPAVSYGFDPAADVAGSNLSLDALGHPSFDVAYKGKPVMSLALRALGEHNALNALAAVACALISGLESSAIKSALEAYSGTHRRFEMTGVVSGVKLYHDYGHHPNEFKTVVPLAARIEHKKLWVVFQPHTYSRTKILFNDFAPSFEGADEVIVTDIYAAREVDPGDVHAMQLVAAMAKHGLKTTYCPTFNDVREYLFNHWHPGDLVLTVGCGNINLLNDMLAE